MKSLHPFPARMAPEIIHSFLENAQNDAIVLDPMCGSGSVIRMAAERGVSAIGLDSDPLAVMMTRVATQPVREALVLDAMKRVLAYACRYGLHSDLAQHISRCEETRAFVRYWFGRKQTRTLNAVVRGIELQCGRYSEPVLNVLRLAVSRIIVTKGKGASLAADVSHSRPHKVMETNDYDVFAGFETAILSILKILNRAEIVRKPRVALDDARKLKSVPREKVDVAITSPPYLNAIDYLRGHRLSLIWLGHTLPALRALRSSNVGAELGRQLSNVEAVTWSNVIDVCPQLEQLPARKIAMVKRYMGDIRKIQKQFSRVLKKGGSLHAVIGDSTLVNVFVPNSDIFRICGEEMGFQLVRQWKREIPANKRYLPTSCSTGMLEKRMRYEVVQTFIFEGAG